MNQAYFLESALESTLNDLHDIGQGLAIIHNHDLEPEQLASLLFLLWEKVEKAIKDGREIAGGKL